MSTVALGDAERHHNVLPRYLATFRASQSQEARQGVLATVRGLHATVGELFAFCFFLFARCTPFFAACGSLSAHTSGGTGTFTPALSLMPAALAALSVQGWLPCLSKGHAVERLPASCLRAHMSIMTRGERPAR